MSRIDPECFPIPRDQIDDDLVCGRCFEDEDLRNCIDANGHPGDCAFCGSSGVNIFPLGGLVDFVEERLAVFFGRAADQLMYVGREGGYQGITCDTDELVFEVVGLQLADDVEVELGDAIRQRLSDECWCDFDAAALDLDDSLKYSWSEFCAIIKHKRRFFFTTIGPGEWDGPDDRTPAAFLSDMADILGSANLVIAWPAGTSIYRARPRQEDEHFDTADSLGPPPPERALQANRMNPPGIPMFYGAENAELATAEVRDQRVSIGRFTTLRDLRILDLANLPDAPGFFSDASRRDRQFLIFLHEFARDISRPVPRDERVHIDYLPTQVFTEFLRDLKLDDQYLDGLRYPSAIDDGANIVLFGGPESVSGTAAQLEENSLPLLELSVVQHR